MLQHVSRRLRSSWAIGGARRDRTADLLRARQALSQLSYGPFNLSFFRQPALHILRTWSHTHMYAPGARKICALSGEKNPALKLPSQDLRFTYSHTLPILLFRFRGSAAAARKRNFSQVVRRRWRSVRQHVSRRLRARCGKLVGLGGFEPPTSPLSGVRSNQLSYRPGAGKVSPRLWKNRQEFKT